jgi:hypothetical protein
MAAPCKPSTHFAKPRLLTFLDTLHDEIYNPNSMEFLVLEIDLFCQNIAILSQN